jgi:hypothetical protein
MRKLVRLFAVSIVGIITFGSLASAAKAPLPTLEPLSVAVRASEGVSEPAIVFRHGDISWLPELAAKAGWPPRTWKRLGEIILRESGGCPTRIGGSVVDKDCNLIRMATMSHPSDTGLLQVNGINWDIERTKLAIVCVRMKVCTQEELMNPITNLRAGKLLWDVAGWTPWNPQK